MPRKGRARRFREARELKQGFDDGLFSEGERSLADVERRRRRPDVDDDDDVDDRRRRDDPPTTTRSAIDDGGRQAAS